MGFKIENKILKRYIAENDEEDIIIPYGIREIGRFCFQGGYNIKSITIPDTVKKIDRFAFEYCKKLVNIKIPLSVVIIEDYAFSCCESLEYIYIPESVKFIGDNIFSDCSSLKKIDISEKNPNYIVKENILFSRDMSNLLSYPVLKPDKFYTVPDTVTRIGGGAFSNSQLVGINLPESLRTIEHLAFASCRKLEYIKIPENIVNLSSMTFLCCENLKSIDMPLSLRVINNYCFDSCRRLEKIKMPFSVDIIQNSFIHCSSVKYMTLFDDKISFSIHTEKNIRYSDIIKILDFFKSGFAEDKFSVINRVDCKIQIALFMLKNFESDFFTAYIRKNIRKAVIFLINENNSDILQKILSYNLIRKKYIDELIQYALSEKKDIIYHMLEDYKIQNKF